MVCVEVWIRPNSTEDKIHGIDPWTERLVVSLRTPPHSGKANRSLVALFSSNLGIPKNQIRIVQGATTRKKIIEIIGTDVVEFQKVGQG